MRATNKSRIAAGFDSAIRPSKNPTAIARANGDVCPRCGAHHVRHGRPTCVGHTSDGRACANWAIRGGTTCAQRHGGSSSHVRAAAERRLNYIEVQGEVAALLREVDLPDQHPIDGLLEAVRHAGAMVRALAVLTAQLDIDPSSAWETVETTNGHKQIRVTRNHPLVRFTHDGDEVPAAVATLYRNWLSLYIQAARTAIDADLDVRLVRNATATTERFYAAVRAGLEAANMTPEQKRVFTEAVADYLRRTDPEYVSTTI